MSKDKINIRDLCINRPSEFEKDSEFMNWFNKSKTLDESFLVGNKDFNEKIFDQISKKILGDTSKKTALEIGFGGGRLMNAACKVFDNVIGIDIHKSFERTKRILEEAGVSNFSLMYENEINKLKNNSIDFIYSFIVFQHFENWEVAERYLDMIDRTLKKDGLAMIYFGRSKTNQEKNIEILSKNRKNNKWWTSLRIKDKHLEEYLSNKFNIIEICRPTQKGGQVFARFTKKE